MRAHLTRPFEHVPSGGQFHQTDVIPPGLVRLNLEAHWGSQFEKSHLTPCFTSISMYDDFDPPTLKATSGRDTAGLRSPIKLTSNPKQGKMNRLNRQTSDPVPKVSRFGCVLESTAKTPPCSGQPVPYQTALTTPRYAF